MLALAGISGCSGGTALEPVSAAALEAEVAERLADEYSVEVEVTCPQALPAEVGATAECTIAASEEVAEPLALTAKVTAVDEDSGEVSFDINVDTSDATPTPAPSGTPPAPSGTPTP